MSDGDAWGGASDTGSRGRDVVYHLMSVALQSHRDGVLSLFFLFLLLSPWLAWDANGHGRFVWAIERQISPNAIARFAPRGIDAHSLHTAYIVGADTIPRGDGMLRGTISFNAGKSQHCSIT